MNTPALTARRGAVFLALLIAAQSAFADDSILRGIATASQWALSACALVIGVYWALYGLSRVRGNHHQTVQMDGLLIGTVCVLFPLVIITLIKTFFL